MGRKIFIFIYLILVFTLINLIVYFVFSLGYFQPLKIFQAQEQKLEIKNSTYTVPQFYPNMKFNHNEITYTIEQICPEKTRQRVLSAFIELSNQTNNLIKFIPTNNQPDIEVICSENSTESISEEYFVAGEGGAKEIVFTGKYSVISNGTIYLYENKETKECDWPNVEIHELLHVFGFDHSTDSESLMYPYLTSCEQKLDKDILDNLIEIYSQENLPDLYFQNVSATQKGKYLSFNATIKNIGLTPAKSVNLSVFENGKQIDTIELEDVSYGAGIKITIENLRLREFNAEKIELVIDSENKIKELDKSNNQLVLTETN